MNETASRSGIIAAGNWVVDHVKVIDVWPQQDTLATILHESFGNGGGAYNVLINLARLGATFPLQAVGLLGHDAAGERILDHCRTQHIDTTQLRLTAEAPTSYTDVMTVRDTGRRTFFHQRGANARLAPEHVDFSGTRAKIFFLGYLLLLDQLDEIRDGLPRAYEVFSRARAAGLLTALDMVSDLSDRFATVVHPVLPLVDVCFANDFEAEKLTGIRLRDENGRLRASSVKSAAREILRLGVRQWAIIHFPEGAHACHVQGDELWQGAVQLSADEIRGTAGAGDAFAAGVLLALHDDHSMRDALELGVCAAAASLRDVTCSNAVGSATACRELGRRWGFRAPLCDAD